MQIDLITLFPQVCADFARLGVTGDALRSNKAQLRAWNPRDYCTNGRPDDRPFGGGAGMVMQAEPLALALQQARSTGTAKRPVVLMSPQGQPLDQPLVRELAAGPGVIILAGRYEGIDERLIQQSVDREIAVGEFVLSGGELPALLLIDAMLRWLPGVLGDADSARDETFVDGTLEYPQYTRPDSWRGHPVPPVLLSGDHQKIARWRAVQALGRTFVKRPDLLDTGALSAEQSAQLREYISEFLASLQTDAAAD